jgi:hypothetical protein
MLNDEEPRTSPTGPEETPPSQYFIFIDQANQMAMHNYRFAKTFRSRFADLLTTSESREVLDKGEVDPMPFVPNPAMHTSLSPFAVSAMSSYSVEWNAELGRKAHAPNSPSRMSAIFAFGDLETCLQVHQTYGWPLASVRRFVLAPQPAARVARVNMDVVSLMRSVWHRASWDPTHMNEVWRHYWTGGAELTVETPDISNGQSWVSHTSGVIWEYLIEGVLHSPDDAPVFGPGA